jgi:branched-chain amino acid transport system permease protein
MLYQNIVSGLSTGILYAITALGLVLLYKITGLINFSHGEMAMLTTFVSFTIMGKLKAPFAVAFILALLFAMLFGVVTEKVLFQKASKLSHLSQINITLATFMVFRGAASIIWGYDPKSYPVPVEGKPISFASITITPSTIFIIILTVILMLGLFSFFKFTKAGLAMQAVAMNPQASRLMGIKVGTASMYAWASSAVLGGVAGMLIAPVTFLDPTMMGEVLIKSFAAAVLGGFSSLPGAVVGGLIIGVVENIIGGYISNELKSTFIFLLIIVVLTVRPKGLFGRNYIKKV